MNTDREILSVRKYKVGYHLQTERVQLNGDDPVVVKSAYTPDGQYIGNSKMARFLIIKKGIKPQYRDGTSGACSIGYCEKDSKWYGWSHRAICGFGVGDKLFEENWAGASEDTPFISHGDETITGMLQAKEAASRFAKSVS